MRQRLLIRYYFDAMRMTLLFSPAAITIIAYAMAYYAGAMISI